MESTNTIMIVDDQEINLQVVDQQLKRCGYKTILAKSGEQAIEKAETLLPDLMLLDVMMPGLNGFETCLKIKENQRIKHIPII